MKALVRKLTSSEFLRNAAILASGTTIAQAIGIFTAPLLTRIYHPESYDVLGLYMMVTGIIGSVATLQYHNVIITAQDDREAVMALSMCIMLGLCIAVISGLLVLAFFPFLSDWLNNKYIRYWLLLAPVSIFFGGWNMAFGAWANRKKDFTLLSRNRIFASVLIPIFSISLGVFVAGPTGLIVGLLISQVIPSISLGYHFIVRNSLQLRFSLSSFMGLAKKFSGFPKYSLPSEFINNVVNQLPVIMFAAYYPIGGIIGNFNLSNRMLGLPVQLIAASMLEVYRKRASTEYDEKGNCYRTFTQTFKLLFFTALLPFGILIFAGPWIFKTVFGANWEIAGQFSGIMAPLFFLKFIVSPLSYVYLIAGRQREDFLLHIIFSIVLFLGLMITNRITNDYYVFLIVFSVLYCLSYLFALSRSYTFSKGRS